MEAGKTVAGEGRGSAADGERSTLICLLKLQNPLHHPCLPSPSHTQPHVGSLSRASAFAISVCDLRRLLKCFSLCMRTAVDCEKGLPCVDVSASSSRSMGDRVCVCVYSVCKGNHSPRLRKTAERVRGHSRKEKRGAKNVEEERRRSTLSLSHA